MAIDVGKEVLAGAVGLGDVGMNCWDKQEGRTEPFKTATDFYRVGATVLGLVTQIFWPRYDKWGEALALAGTPLAVKSIVTPILSQVMKQTTSSPAGGFTPRARAGTGFRQTVKPEMEDVGTF